MKEEYYNEISISFVVKDFQTNDEHLITEIIGLFPTKLNLVGKRNPLGGPIRINKWIYQLPVTKNFDFNYELGKFLEIFEPKVDKIRELNKGYKCEIVCAIWYFDKSVSFPSIRLEKRYNEFVSKTNVELDIDIYASS